MTDAHADSLHIRPSRSCGVMKLLGDVSAEVEALERSLTTEVEELKRSVAQADAELLRFKQQIDVDKREMLAKAASDMTAALEEQATRHAVQLQQALIQQASELTNQTVNKTKDKTNKGRKRCGHEKSMFANKPQTTNTDTATETSSHIRLDSGHPEAAEPTYTLKLQNGIDETMANIPLFMPTDGSLVHIEGPAPTSAYLAEWAGERIKVTTPNSDWIYPIDGTKFAVDARHDHSHPVYHIPSVLLEEHMHLVNCRFMIYEKYSVWLVSTRDIQDGEALISDYYLDNQEQLEAWQVNNATGAAAAAASAGPASKKAKV